ncbi:terminase small subunit [Ruminococcus sp. NK3A76]|uniref:terminase small subunit n=1 Tax=Ruminococcus sp. NK3A76 TaxID=877411 RepID=UPI00068D0C04|nr:terminase small subunit [Ruminococcus sp. NK3A76]
MLISKKPRLPPETVERFCLELFSCCSPREAARRTGIDESAGIRLSLSRRVQKRLAKYYASREYTLMRAREGLERIAFGRVNDAVELALSGDEENYSRFDGADLFSVSEIKRVKGGGVEIKFFDRLKAIEQLVSLDERIRGISEGDEFVRAFEQAAQEGDVDEQA